MLYTSQKILEHGNKPVRLLAYLTRPHHSSISIPRILTSQGLISDAPFEIVETFLSFCRNLYDTRVQYSAYQLCAYLGQVSLPSLSTTMREELSPVCGINLFGFFAAADA